jgi:hypothetical protein
VPSEDGIWNIEHTVVCVEVFDGGAPAGCITLSEDIPVQVTRWNRSGFDLSDGSD